MMDDADHDYMLTATFCTTILLHYFWSLETVDQCTTVILIIRCNIWQSDNMVSA